MDDEQGAEAAGGGEVTEDYLKALVALFAIVGLLYGLVLAVGVLKRRWPG